MMYRKLDIIYKKERQDVKKFVIGIGLLNTYLHFIEYQILCEGPTVQFLEQVQGKQRIFLPKYFVNRIILYNFTARNKIKGQRGGDVLR